MRIPRDIFNLPGLESLLKMELKLNGTVGCDIHAYSEKFVSISAVSGYNVIYCYENKRYTINMYH